ncbi:MAG: DUF5615 family PIN-like protein [Firmicutes bacterium]|nr:DUF5615 family PIN-like protein [Bacillota bacterium]
MRGVRRAGHQGGGGDSRTAIFRFLTDQDVYEKTVRQLLEWGHDVVRARDAGLSAATDAELLAYAERTGRILITRDKGFGQLVFAQRRPHAGVILLRITPETISDIHLQLARFLSKYATEQLSNTFVTLESGRYRLRRTPTGSE